MEITINKLLEGKSTVIKGREYFETKEYVTPFIDLMKKLTTDFSIKAKMPNQLTLTDNKEDVTYNEVWVQAILPEKCDKAGFAETYNLVYSLDTRLPVYKLFKAYMDRKSNNLFVFDSRWLKIWELKPNTHFIDFQPVVKELLEMVDDSAIRFNNMKGTYFSSEEKPRQRQLGQLIEHSMIFDYKTKGGKVKISPAMVLKAYESVYLDNASKYYIGESDSSLFNYVNAFSELVKEDASKSALNVFEKSALILQIFNTELWK